jgi:hypothetical protein
VRQMAGRAWPERRRRVFADLSRIVASAWARPRRRCAVGRARLASSAICG